MYALHFSTARRVRRAATAPQRSMLAGVLVGVLAGWGLTSPVHAGVKALKPGPAAKSAAHAPAAKARGAASRRGTAAARATSAAAPVLPQAPTAAADADTDEVSAQQGMGSWYGKQFHGRQTASGEIYNMYAFTAAHRTLPIPSFARVRNASNGREVVVRINDRGPYVGKRVIDLSMAAAQHLGIHGVGRVQILPLSADAVRSGKWREVDGRPATPAAASFALATSGTGAALSRPGVGSPLAIGRMPDESADAGAASETLTVAADAGLRQPVEEPAARDERGVDGYGVADTLAAAPEAMRPASDPDAIIEAVAVEPVVAGARHAQRPRTAQQALSTQGRGALPHATAAAPGGAPTEPAATRSAGTAPASAPNGATGRDSKDAGMRDARDGAPALATFNGPVQPTTLAGGSAASATAGTANGVQPAPLVPAGVMLAASGTAPVLSAATPGETGPSLLASVAATVSPVLTGIARSATDFKDAVVSLATPATLAAKPVAARTNTASAAVQVDPARTSNGRGWWLQLGAFQQSDNAMSLQHKVIDMAPWLGPLLGIFDERGQQKLQAGPYPSREQAQKALERAREALKLTPTMVERR